jgi:Bacteriocin-protection, YdeI or OmpD-Associated
MKRVAVMIENGLLHPAGRKAFELREEKRSAVYSFEQENIAFARPQEQRFRMNRAAWKFFQSQPAWYRRAATWWVINAKREETREKRLAVLIDDSESNRTVKNLTRPVAGSKGSELP